MEHTPGPWKIRRTRKVGAAKPDRAIVYHEGDYAKQVCVIHLVKATLNENEANAALIASAPELLEALQALSMAVTHKTRCAALTKASFAIAKATQED
jgi:hypothetical protein